LESASAVKGGAPSSRPPNWMQAEETNKMDGVKTTTFTTIATDRAEVSLVLRFTGDNLDIYSITGEVVGDEEGVRVRFDDGSPEKQRWSRSKDSVGLFSPHPVELLTKLQSSRTFYLEYHPYQSTARTVEFNVAGLPPAPPSWIESQNEKRQRDIAAQKKQHDGDIAAQKKQQDDELLATSTLKARILPRIQPCQRFPNEWCWSDSEGHFAVRFASKEEAFDNAMDAAQAGRAFVK